MVKKVVLWLLVLGCMAVIFSFSGQSAEESTGLSDSLLYDVLSFLKLELSETMIAFLSVFIRKVAHFSIYALLGALICLLMKWGYLLAGKRCFFAPVAISALYAFTDEFHQLFISGRSGQIKDVLIDSSGAVVGTVFVILLFSLLKRRQKNG